MLPSAPDPRFVRSGDVQLATYEIGEPDAPPVMLVHGFASSAEANWVLTGWTRELTRSGFRVIALDNRAHGRSDKPHDRAAYSMPTMRDDVFRVMDAYRITSAPWVGYSMGARVTWYSALTENERVSRAVLGGIPKADPFARLDVKQARDYTHMGLPITDAVTRTYIEMAAEQRDNDLFALVALVEGLRGDPHAAIDEAPPQPLLIAAGSDDAIAAEARTLADEAPNARFVGLPGRTHFNAPTSGLFRREAIAFLKEGA
ncbi:alpha/beta fold hydrolase [Paramicrobacterium agarici]|uniref:Pimeloyl-ACP methyl ester carboxylesterase n=1 Tax=Paramicrobacterium agarici TaxID=630514 RepID=A0A2A9DR79_9MICO|nr:alpha/beta fold hydrolase [Microbacterium agarici]PFG29198.1 pimeloyl-ACP methyl ester carboxylesterase [Microbacterium agarici]TQO22162.1 pimeloyl-ACP methyl ester carboxylesterase [Microbacterium agarici]